MMKRIAAAFLFLLCLMGPELCLAWSAKCLRVEDGDSLVVEYQGTRESGQRKEREIRLYGIDCPEGGQRFGNIATRFTREKAEGKTVEVSVIDCDCSKGRCRLVAWVSVDGQSLNKELLSAGLAWWYDYYAPGERELKELQEKAKADTKGLWKDSDAIPPWKFRDQHEGKK